MKKIFLALAALSTMAAVFFLAWAWASYPPMEEALDAMRSDEKVKVVQGEELVFVPRGRKAAGGLVFYPGGKVDHRAYAPFARRLAEAGYLVVVVPMPLNLAVLAPGKGLGVIEKYSEVRSWVIGGHSLGGAMAARTAYRNPGRFRGLLLLAAYPPAGDDLSGSGLPVVSIYGSSDSMVAGGKLAESRKLLPEDAEFVQIPGGNHSQFGWYGRQKGDAEASLSREEQQKSAVKAAIKLLKTASAPRNAG